MLGQVMPNNERIKELSKDIVFILGHMQEAPEGLYKTWIQYMPHTFYTPTYVFLDSNSEPMFEEVSKKYEHRMIKEDKLVSILEEFLTKHGKGLSFEKWEKYKERFNKADTVEALDAFIKEKPSPAFVKKALRKKQVISNTHYFKSEAEKMTDKESGRFKALAQAIKGNLFSAQALCRESSELKERIDAQLEGAVTGSKIHPRKIPIYGKDHPYIEVVVRLATTPPNVEEITIQYWALTESGQVFAGFQTYQNMKPYFRHVVSAYLPLEEVNREEAIKGRFKYEGIKDVRYEVHVSGKCLYSRNMVESPETEWWKNRNNLKSLQFLKYPGWGWHSNTRMTLADKGKVYLE